MVKKKKKECTGQDQESMFYICGCGTGSSITSLKHNPVDSVSQSFSTVQRIELLFCCGR